MFDIEPSAFLWPWSHERIVIIKRVVHCIDLLSGNPNYGNCSSNFKDEHSAFSPDIIHVCSISVVPGSECRQSISRYNNRIVYIMGFGSARVKLHNPPKYTSLISIGLLLYLGTSQYDVYIYYTHLFNKLLGSRHRNLTSCSIHRTRHLHTPHTTHTHIFISDFVTYRELLKSSTVSRSGVSRCVQVRCVQVCPGQVCPGVSRSGVFRCVQVRCVQVSGLVVFPSPRRSQMRVHVACRLK